MLAQEWSTMIEKLMDVLWLSFRDAYRVLEQNPDGVEAKSLRAALGHIFPRRKGPTCFGEFFGTD